MKANRLWIRWTWVALLAGTMQACGTGKAETEATPPVVLPPGVPTLESISIDPVAVTLPLGSAVVLSAHATWSDGEYRAYSCQWTSSNSDIVGVETPGASVTLVTGLAFGSATVTVEVDGLMSADVAVTVTYDIPADPGLLYATSNTFPRDGIPNNAILKYGSPGAPAEIVYRFSAAWDGLQVAMNPAGSAIYAQVAGSRNAAGAVTSYAIDRIDLATFTVQRVAAPPMAAVLDFGYDGMLYGAEFTTGLTGGRVYRIDPATGEVQVLGTTARYQLGLAMGTDGNAYTCRTNSGGACITRFDPSTATSRAWAPELPGEVVISSLAMDRLGRATIASLYQTDQVFRFEDLNGDGDALDYIEATGAEEGRTFGVVPGAISSTGMGAMGSGPGGSCFVSVLYSSYDAPGVYWLADRNGDGVCDETEVTLYSPTVADNYSGAAIQARR